MRDIIEEIKEEVIKDIEFITEKMLIMRSKINTSEYLDIKQMADFHRYSETRLFLLQTLKSLEGDDREDD